MRHVARLTSEGNQYLWLPPKALQKEFYPFFEHVVARMRAGLTDTVVVDGRPGAGKTQFSIGLSRFFDEQGIPFARVSTDDDTIPRDERNGKELFEFHPGEVVTEAIKARCKGGATLSFDRYNNATGRRDLPTRRVIPATENGALLVEGVSSIEHVRHFMSHLRSETEDRILYVLLDEPSAVANRRRIERDINVKEFPLKEASRRVRVQESSIVAYYDDLIKDFRKISHSTICRGDI